MKILFPVIILILLNSESIAASFTILAESGLNVREEPTLDSKKIASIPFGTVVDALIDEGFMDDGVIYGRYTEVIEGKRGFWMKMKFGKIEGFIFSGYGLLGHWAIESSQINKDYRILQVGDYCDPINYDPELNWYALIKINGKLTIKKAEVFIRLTHEYNEKDTIGSDNEFWRQFPIKIQTNIPDTIFFLIGSSIVLDEGSMASNFLGNRWGYGTDAEFLYPEENFRHYFENKSYTYRAYEDVKLDNNLPNGYKKHYQISLNILPDDLNFNLSTELSLSETGELHSLYKTPQLIWIGDLNNDKKLDFIYYSHTMTESCGVCWHYHLFMSEHDTMNIKKVADHNTCNCIT